MIGDPVILDAETAGAYSGRVRDARELERIEYHAAVQTSPTANVILIAKMNAPHGPDGSVRSSSLLGVSS